MSTFKFLTQQSTIVTRSGRFLARRENAKSTIPTSLWNSRINTERLFCCLNRRNSRHSSRNQFNSVWSPIEISTPYPLEKQRLPYCKNVDPRNQGAATPTAEGSATGTTPPPPKTVSNLEERLFGESSKLGLFAKFKLMYKKYWYVLIPVHLVTSIGWFGGFYYMSQSGVDIGALLQYINVSETIIEKMHKSSMGHLAVAYLCYKIATPLRYGVTLGGTTVAIKHLVRSGYIKPVPSKNQLMAMIEQKKTDLTNAKDEWMQKRDDRKRKENE